MKDFIKQNEQTYRDWIDRNETVQISSDLVTPLIPEFQKEFPSVNLTGCKECVIDMLRWALIQIKPKSNDKSNDAPSTDGDILD